MNMAIKCWKLLLERYHSIANNSGPHTKWLKANWRHGTVCTESTLSHWNTFMLFQRYPRDIRTAGDNWELHSTWASNQWTLVVSTLGQHLNNIQRLRRASLVEHSVGPALCARPKLAHHCPCRCRSTYRQAQWWLVYQTCFLVFFSDSDSILFVPVTPSHMVAEIWRNLATFRIWGIS